MEITKDLVELINEAIESMGYYVEATVVNKNNSVKNGLIIRKTGLPTSICPTIYLEEFEKFEDVLEYIHQVINKPQPTIDVDGLMERNYILNNVRAQVVSAGNVLLGPDVVYRDFLDMAIG